MLPRHPSHPPITEPTILSSIIATRSTPPGALVKRVNLSIESVTLGGVTSASCQSRSTAESSLSRAGRMIVSDDIVAAAATKAGFHRIVIPRPIPLVEAVITATLLSSLPIGRAPSQLPALHT